MMQAKQQNGKSGILSKELIHLSCSHEGIVINTILLLSRIEPCDLEFRSTAVEEEMDILRKYRIPSRTYCLIKLQMLPNPSTSKR